LAALSAFEKYLLVLEAFTHKADHMLTAQDPYLLEKLELSERQVLRILDEMERVCDPIVSLENTRPKKFKLLKPIDLFEEAFANTDDLGWLFELAKEKDPEVFSRLSNYSRHTEHIYQLHNTPFEDLEDIETKQSFRHLKTAVKNREYRNITFYDGKCFNDVKCLKLLFMEGNWYLAYVTTEGKLRLGRINFIKEVAYASKSASFQPSSVQEEMRFLKKQLQNPFTLYGKSTQTATLKALPKIAHYFDKGMKPFLSSQKFLEKFDDGSVRFEVIYTQPMEILPLIQKWMPDLIIESPASLQKTYTDKLQQALAHYDQNIS
jgi:predicted DNA-binding transcriptional regulator YafY